MQVFRDTKKKSSERVTRHSFLSSTARAANRLAAAPARVKSRCALPMLLRTNVAAGGGPFEIMLESPV